MPPKGSEVDIASTRSTVKNCKVCQLGYGTLAAVNRMIVDGFQITEIKRILTQWQDERRIHRAPSLASLYNHKNKHLALNDQVVRRYIEKRAEEANIPLEDGVETLLTVQSVVDVTLFKGFKEIAEGRATPTVKETLEAAKIKAQFEKDGASVSSEIAYLAQVNKIIRAVKDNVSPEQWERIVRQLEAPDTEQIESSYIEAEVLEEEDY